MELSVRQSDLLRELQLFQGIVERKNTIPILGNVLLEANGDGSLQMLATDLEVGLRSRCTAEISEPGSLTIPAKKLFEIVRALPETEIRIQQGPKGAVEVAAAQFDSRMQTLPREDFPTVPEPGSGWSAVLPRAVLGEMVAKTQFAITGEDTRYFLNGALLVLAEGRMTLVATDGHRLALAAAARGADESPPPGGDEQRAILPKKTLGELARLLSDGEGDVTCEFTENHLFFEIDGRHLISRMIDAQFPAYERVIPQGNDKRIEFERDRLLRAVRRVALLSSERSRAIRFQIDTNSVEVRSSSPEVGEAKEVLEVEYAGGALQICFNAQYVTDFLGAADTDSVGLEFRDEMSQAVMQPVGADGCEYTYVIMPMRV